MDVNYYRDKISEIRIDGDKQYLSFQFSFESLDITPLKVFQFFEAYQGKRYWYRSKRDAYHFNKVGIDYIATIRKDRFNDKELLQEKQALFESIQTIDFDLENTSKLSLFGGMKFASEETTDEWNDFSYIGFLLSRYQFDFINKVIHYTDKREFIQVDNIINDVDQLLKDLHAFNIQPTVKPIISKEKELFVKGWKKLVAKTIDKLDDDFRKVVLSRQKLLMFSQPLDTHFLVEKLLDDIEDFTIVFERHSAVFVSKSPERLFYIHDNHLTTSAVAGSAPKVNDENIDRETQLELLNDSKNTFEHELVSEEIIQDLSQYSDSVDAPEGTKILENKYIFHLETPIVATLSEGVNVFSILNTLHPTPALGGIPKDKAMKYIVSKEYGARGMYAAPIGLIHEDNDSEFAVSIRSMFISDNSATLYAGCGIVKESDVETEFEETRVKFKPMLNLLEAEDES